MRSPTTRETLVQAAIVQIQSLGLQYRTPCKVVDLSAGDHRYLPLVRELIPAAEYTCIDLSSQHGLPQSSHDLVLAHALSTTISIHSLLHYAHSLTHATGYLSLITTTYDSFPVTQQYLAELINQGSLWSSRVGHFCKSLIHQTAVAVSKENLLCSLAHYDWQLCTHQRFEIPLVFDNLDELAEFLLESTWFFNRLSVKMRPKHFMLPRIKRLCSKLVTFPYRDTQIIDVVLAKR